MVIQRSHLTLASAAALFALANGAVMAPAYAAGQAATAPCYGVNACKGQSDCKSGNHECKGQNSCKGQGFKDLTAKQCKAEHGSTTEN